MRGVARQENAALPESRRELRGGGERADVLDLDRQVRDAGGGPDGRE
jgi:hypothetical protein